jgi:dolichol-phosphate mannosyltransferase
LNDADAPTAADQPDPSAQPAELTLSVVIPTLNEVGNVREIARRLAGVLGDEGWEIIFVDDCSPDGTADAVRELARRNLRVRCLERVGRRGLSSACVEGVLASSAPYVAIMDADLQHDERLLPAMLSALQAGNLDVVIASRYVAGAGIGSWRQSRAAMSRFASKLSRFVVRADLSDPMSGFFMFPRNVLHDNLPRLSGISFKILLDLFASSPRPLRFKEIPYTFRERHAGVSKFGAAAALDYLWLLVDKLTFGYIPVRFLAFSAVGSVGVLVHLAVLTFLFKAAGSDFTIAQSIATVVAMTSNLLLNNAFTYQDKRLKGWRLLRGWASFALVCGIGALANVGVAAYLFAHDSYWLVSALAGILISAIWNYAVSAKYTWNQ